MAKLIVIQFEAPDNLRRALSIYAHGKKGGMVTKRAVHDWAVGIIEQASLDLQFRLSKGRNVVGSTRMYDDSPTHDQISQGKSDGQ